MLGRSKHGGLNVLCYQYGGDSVSGLKYRGSADNWRCISLPKLTAVCFLDEAWETAEDHVRPQSCITEVFFDAEQLFAAGSGR